MKTIICLFKTLFLLVVIFMYSCSESAILDEDEIVMIDEEFGDENGNNDEEMNDSGNTDNEENTDSDSNEDSSENQGNCENPEDFIFSEDNGLVVVEFENTQIEADWQNNDSEPDFSGDGYLVWNGSQSLGNPGNGLLTFKIEIETFGTYQFVWNSAVTIGDNGTEHNDTWLRFNDADDFFGKKGESIVYPKGTGKTPNPEGSSADGWFKIYRSGNDLSFKWQSKTSDNDAHDIFVTFNEPGIYLMEVSARSSGHAIDKFVLFTDSYAMNEATEGNNPLSTIRCD